MKFTFGIVTNKNMVFVDRVISSILGMDIPEDRFEIITIGGMTNYTHKNITSYPFEESDLGGWITKKKNLITSYAKFDNIVYLHDYLVFDKDWYKSFLKFGDKFDICMSKIITEDGLRYRDWTFYSGLVKGLPIPDDVKSIMFASGNWYIPYSVSNKNLKKYMYINGAYWIAKKQVMQEFPLNESLFWGQGEDVEWSKRVVTKYDLSLNPDSIIRLIKHKGPLFCEIDPQYIPYLEAVK